jgi:hypothetical protein
MLAELSFAAQRCHIAVGQHGVARIAAAIEAALILGGLGELLPGCKEVSVRQFIHHNLHNAKKPQAWGRHACGFLVSWPASWQLQPHSARALPLYWRQDFQYRPSARSTTMITTIAPMMYRIEGMLCPLCVESRYSDLARPRLLTDGQHV